VKYAVYLEREVHYSRARLPGNVRQRVRRVIAAFSSDPRPAGSVALDISAIEVPASVEVRRYRLGAWRVVYAVNEEAKWVWVLAVRRRPPYDYGDLADPVGGLHDEPDEQPCMLRPVRREARLLRRGASTSSRAVTG
jgi:mRNA-degrading endonuclease RelE of RelBE toxin-antitoxin system